MPGDDNREGGKNIKSSSRGREEGRNGSKDKRSRSKSNNSKQGMSESSVDSVNKKPKVMNIENLDRDTVGKYVRGAMQINTKNVKYKGLRLKLTDKQDNMIENAKKTAAAEILLTGEAGMIETEGNERTYKMRQEEILQHVDLNTSRNAIDLQLTKFGPYRVDYTRNGRFMLFGGRKGHVAVLDCLRMTVGTELQLKEEAHDVHYLHNETMFAVAQQKYTYIYDYKGVEIHCMKQHERTFRLDFLPYHYLLTSVGHSGWIKWQDISIGEYVAGYQTGHGPCKVLKHNRVNAVSHVGHSNGVVSLWSPAKGKALVSMFCHKSPVTDLAIDRSGLYMASTGLDGYLKIWDLRMFKNLHCYKLDHPGMSVDISDRGLVAVALGRSAQVLRNAFTQPTDVTYMNHTIRTPNATLSSGGGATAAARALASSVHTGCVRFRPLEDVLGVGHTHGITTIIVPGAGEPNYDTFESDPFMNPKQRREQEVQSLLHKLSHEMIGLDASFIGSVDKDQEAIKKEHNEIFYAANKGDLTKKKEKNRKRGRNKISKKLQRKQKNVIDAHALKLKETLQKQKEAREKEREQGSGGCGGGGSDGRKEEKNFDPLRRFQQKKT